MTFFCCCCCCCFKAAACSALCPLPVVLVITTLPRRITFDTCTVSNASIVIIPNQHGYFMAIIRMKLIPTKGRRTRMKRGYHRIHSTLGLYTASHWTRNQRKKIIALIRGLTNAYFLVSSRFGDGKCFVLPLAVCCCCCRCWWWWCCWCCNVSISNFFGVLRTSKYNTYNNSV